MYAFSTIVNHKFETQVIFGNCTLIPLNWLLLCSIQTNNNLKIKREKEKKKMPLNQKRLRWTFPHSNQIRNCCRHRCRHFFACLFSSLATANAEKSPWNKINMEIWRECKAALWIETHSWNANKQTAKLYKWTNKTIWEKVWVEKRINIEKMRSLKKRRRKNGEFIRKEMNDCS